MSLTGKAKQNMLLKGRINRLKVIHTDAYELAVKNGFEGTLEEWLESLRGEAGPAGKVDENCMVLKDQATGQYYKIYVENDTLTMAECDEPDAPPLSADWLDRSEFDSFTESYAKVKRGVDRKLLAITGNLADRQKQGVIDNEYSYCRVLEVGADYMDINVSGIAHKRTIRLSTAAAATQYEVSRLSGYSFTRGTVYSTTATAKRIIDVNIEDKRYTDIEVLKTVGFAFRNLIINYEVQIDETNVCLVTLCITPDMISICETVPEAMKDTLVTSLVGGANVTPVVTHGTSMMVFTIKDGKRYYTERVEQVGNSVLKTFNMKGGF